MKVWLIIVGGCTAVMLLYLPWYFLPTIIAMALWATVAGAVLWISKSFLKSFPRTKTLVTWVLAIAFIWAPFWSIFPGIYLADSQCDQIGGLVIARPVSSEGYLRMANLRWPESTDQYSPEEIVRDLAVRRFKYVEEEQGLQFADEMRKDAQGNGRMIYRFYLAPAYSRECAAFEAQMERHTHMRKAVRKLGLPENLCVASEKSDTILSSYAISHDEYTSDSLISIAWKRLRVVERSTGIVFGEYRYFFYPAFGNNFMGQFVGVSTSCKNRGGLFTLQNEIILPSETTGFLDRLNAGPASPVRQFYADKRPNRVTAIPVRMSDRPEKLSDVTLLESNYTTYAITEKAFQLLRDKEDLNGTISIEDTVPNQSASRTYETSMRIIRGKEITTIPLQPALAPLSWSFHIETARVQGNSITLVSRFDEEKVEIWSIASFAFNGDLIGAVRFKSPAVNWKGPVKGVVKSVSRTDGGFTITLIDAAPSRYGYLVHAEYSYFVSR